MHGHVQVAGRAGGSGGAGAISRQSGSAQLDPGPVAHAGWDLDLEVATVDVDHSLRTARHFGERHLGVGLEVNACQPGSVCGRRAGAGPLCAAPEEISEVKDLLIRATRTLAASSGSR